MSKIYLHINTDFDSNKDYIEFLTLRNSAYFKCTTEPERCTSHFDKLYPDIHGSICSKYYIEHYRIDLFVAVDYDLIKPFIKLEYISGTLNRYMNVIPNTKEFRNFIEKYIA